MRIRKLTSWLLPVIALPLAVVIGFSVAFALIAVCRVLTGWEVLKHADGDGLMVVCTLFGGAPAMFAAIRLLNHLERPRLRKKRGLCPACGYDLRATPGRCPECGKDSSDPPPQSGG